MRGHEPEAVDAARRLAQESECDRASLLDQLCGEGFDREAARRAVQRLSFEDEPSISVE